MTALEMHDVVVTHAGRRLVDVPHLRVGPDRPVTIVGESGSGKSLLAHALMGTLASTLEVDGKVDIGGRLLPLAERGNRRALWGSEVAMLPQEPALALDPTMRVGRQVAEGVLGATRETARTRAAAALASVGLPGASRTFPHTLSGGMAQRVAYAAATVGGARVLVVDEPSKGLDPASVDRLAELLLRHVVDGGLLLTITHDLRLAAALGGEVAVMRDAEVLESGEAAQVLERPRHDYTRRLVAAAPERWRHPWQRTGWETTAEPLVEATGLAKAYGSQQLFADLDVRVRPGERVALSGPSGVGKTTLGGALLRIVAPDAGRVVHHDSLRGRVQKLYQDPALSFPTLVPIEVGLRDVVKRHGADPRRLDQLVADLRLAPELLTRRPAEVSGGELQRVAIARMLLARPRLVLADEATSRLDLLTQETTIDALVRGLDDDAALLVVTHDSALADAVADTHLHLSGGDGQDAT
ncbi:ABC transporter ATP-binding protein [Nocardioides ganghwensis]|uniref:ABC transporter ATP-binding protein n=1 Tax=Nocardioides ganghwensis TaxID=252230 RepID=A0A4Q2SEQ4_9ACTN|nr:ATP-binding cassette domain-containing protein [Nocardioides ganghwensis]MBD3944001.1 ABC transporter ATP-binding protein [Nocardioides ganghwensis]RYC01562.1 ABC transporter ATP-binding protein [Nocardioides ganghwensis]